MRITVLLAVLMTVLAVSSALPQNCRGPRCRSLRPAPQRPNLAAPSPAVSRTRPQPGKPPVPNLRSGSNSRPVPNRRPGSNRRPVTTTTTTSKAVSVTEQPTSLDVAAVTEQRMVTDNAGNEVREVGVNGWLASPTPPPVSAEFLRETPTSKPEKPGSCDTPRGFGIKCMQRLDQCTVDHQCPGSTKCCMVGECGYLCVKPKATSTELKEVMKEPLNKNKKGDKTKVKDVLLAEASEIVPAVELPEGALKAEDIIENPKDIENLKKEPEVVKPKEEEGDKEVKKPKEEVKELEDDVEDESEGNETTTQLPVDDVEDEAKASEE